MEDLENDLLCILFMDIPSVHLSHHSQEGGGFMLDLTYIKITIFLDEKPPPL